MSKPGRKKPFISKKNAVVFNVVARSQSDPLIDDENASKYVFNVSRLPKGVKHAQSVLPKDLANELMPDRVMDRDPYANREQDSPDFSSRRGGKLVDINFDDEDYDEEDGEYFDDEEVDGEYEDLSRREESKQEVRVHGEQNFPNYLGARNYDYSQHLRTITGTGVFIGANGAVADPKAGEIEQVYDENEKYEELYGVRPPDETQIQQTVAALKKIKPGKSVKMSKDFHEALEVGNEQGFLELEDNFFELAMQSDGEDDEDDKETSQDADKSKSKSGAASTREGRQRYDQDYEDYDEDDEDYDSNGQNYRDYGDDDEDYEEDEEGEGTREFNKYKAAQAQKQKAYTDTRKNRAIDNQFDKFLEGYDDDDIGELDEDDDNVQGKVERDEVIDTYKQELDSFITKRDYGAGEAGSEAITLEDVKEVALQQIQNQLMKLQVEETKDVKKELEKTFKRRDKEQWDAESIRSTYSNTENIPAVIRDVNRANLKKKQILLSKKTGIPLGVLPDRRNKNEVASSSSKSDIHAIDAIDEAGEHNAVDAEPGKDDDDDVEEDEEEDEEVTNRGERRNKKETAEEKKARKAAVKAAKRLGRQKKKNLKVLFKTEESKEIKTMISNKISNPSLKRID
jgi:protein LTV1